MPKKPVSPAVEYFRSFISKEVGAVAPQLLHSVVPIFTADDVGIPHLAGSGTLIVVGGRYFIVTAAHVIDAYNHSELYTVRSGRHSIQLDRYLLATRAPNGDRDKDRIDIGFIEIRGECVDYFGRDSFCPVTSFDVAHVEEESAKFLAMGYPHSKNRTRRKAPFNKDTCAMFHLSELGAAKYFEKLRLNAQYHLLIRFNKGRVTIDGKRGTAPDPYGMSGGPLWRFDFKTPREIPTLAGILIEWNKQHGGFVVVRASVVLTILFQAYPDLGKQVFDLATQALRDSASRIEP